MTDLERILDLWRTLEITGTEFVLVTVTEVEGPGYRKPGALMLISADGRRAGAISGGCLEAEVAKRAFWLTAGGPCIER
jgi:xanthine dehydrogenase accessory factor